MKASLRTGVLCLLLLALAASAFGQAVTASSSITGTVEDSTGAVIVGAAVTVTSAATGVTRTTVTGDIGTYRIDAVPPGVYMVKVTKSGFASVTFDKVELVVGRTTTQNVKLNPGAESQVVEVQAGAQLLDQEKTSVGARDSPQ